jgi:hypothetical protein
MEVKTSDLTLVSKDIHEKIQAYKAFWEKANPTPLIGYSVGNYFVSKRFEAAQGLLGKEITQYSFKGIFGGGIFETVFCRLRTSRLSRRTPGMFNHPSYKDFSLSISKERGMGIIG